LDRHCSAASTPQVHDWPRAGQSRDQSPCPVPHHTMPGTTGHVIIHYARPGKTALDCDGAVAMRLYQALEELVAEQKNVLAAVEGFSKAKQLHESSSETMTLSMEASKVSDESTENGIASCRILLSSVACINGSRCHILNSSRPSINCFRQIFSISSPF